MPLIHQLPLFAEDLAKNDSWPSYIGQMLDAEFSWVAKNKASLNLPADLEPYFVRAIRLWEMAAVVSANRAQLFAAYSLRAILERVALLWAAHPSVPLDIAKLVADFESDNYKTRKAASEEIFDAASEQDKMLKELYDILSRYYGHISHLDRVPVKFDDPKDRLLAVRSVTIPLFLLFDVGHCVLNLVSELLTAQGKTPPPVVSGRNQKVNPYRFMRVASYVMCEKHSVKKAFKFGVLYNGIAGISGQVGITNIYRGGMDVYRYRADGEDPAHVPSHGQMAEFAVFAVGYQNKDAIKVKLEEAYPKGEKFRVTWDKTFEIDGSCLAQHASQRISDPYPFFDYVSAFTKAIKDHEKVKAAKAKNP